jgi:hypothetical protein
MKYTVMIDNAANHKHVLITLKAIPIASLYLIKLVICKKNFIVVKLRYVQLRS